MNIHQIRPPLLARHNWRQRQLQLCAVAATHAPTRQRPSAAPGASALRIRVLSAAQSNILHVRAMPAQALTSNSDPRRPKPNLGSSRADVLKIQVQPSARASVRSPTARTMHVHTIRSLASKLMHESNTAGRYLCAAARSACSETLSKVTRQLARRGTRPGPDNFSNLPHAVRYARGGAPHAKGATFIIAWHGIMSCRTKFFTPRHCFTPCFAGGRNRPRGGVCAQSSSARTPRSNSSV